MSNTKKVKAKPKPVSRTKPGTAVVEQPPVDRRTFTLNDEGERVYLPDDQQPSRRFTLNDEGERVYAQPEVVEGQVVTFNASQRAKLDQHVATARHEFAGMVTHFHASVARIAKAVLDAKSLAGQLRVPFDSLFGDQSDPTKFPFSQNWANRFIRVYKAKILDAEIVKRLPPDLNVLDTIVGAPTDKQAAVIEEYEEQRKAGKSAQDAAREAKKKAGGPASPKARPPREKRTDTYFDPSDFRSMDDLADVLVDKIDDDDTCKALAEEICKRVQMEPPSPKGKQPPKAAPEDSRDVKAETRGFCAGMTGLMLSEVLAEVKKIMEDVK